MGKEGQGRAGAPRQRQVCGIRLKLRAAGGKGLSRRMNHGHGGGQGQGRVHRLQCRQGEGAPCGGHGAAGKSTGGFCSRAGGRAGGWRLLYWKRSHSSSRWATRRRAVSSAEGCAAATGAGAASTAGAASGNAAGGAAMAAEDTAAVAVTMLLAWGAGGSWGATGRGERGGAGRTAATVTWRAARLNTGMVRAHERGSGGAGA